MADTVDLGPQVPTVVPLGATGPTSVDLGGGAPIPGPPGESAYEVAVAEGFEGTEAEWLASLVGSPGADGQDGQDGAPGEDGASAYQVAVAGGFVGTEQDWLASLVGPPGADGADGHSPVVTWDGSVIVVDDTPGPDLRGPAGQDGQDGAKGDKGDPGPGVPNGGTTGQVLAKASGDDRDTEWVDQAGGGGGGGVQQANAALAPNPDTTARIVITEASLVRIGDLVFASVNVKLPKADHRGAELFTAPNGFRPSSDSPPLPGVAFPVSSPPQSAIFAADTYGRLTLEVADSPTQEYVAVQTFWRTSDPFPAA